MTFVGKSRRTPTESTEALVERLFRRTGVDGVYGRTERYERVVDGLGTLITSFREPGTEAFRFPPVMSRALIERLGYLKSFPNLLGCVCGLSGSEREISETVERFAAGREWTSALAPGDLALAPAACYPVYPIAAERAITPEGVVFDVAADCFRREPSTDIDRLQSFRMREFVFVGGAEQALRFRDRWIEQAQHVADKLELSHRVAAASDPFFGRVGVLLSNTQAEQQLKYELLVPVRSADNPTACMSFNYHRDLFGAAANIRDDRQKALHSSCVAFGVDRLTIALFATHGLETGEWPVAVKKTLGL